jgi:hypothetical protein
MLLVFTQPFESRQTSSGAAKVENASFSGPLKEAYEGMNTWGKCFCKALSSQTNAANVVCAREALPDLWKKAPAASISRRVSPTTFPGRGPCSCCTAVSSMLTSTRSSPTNASPKSQRVQIHQSRTWLRKCGKYRPPDIGVADLWPYGPSLPSTTKKEIKKGPQIWGSFSAPPTMTQGVLDMGSISVWRGPTNALEGDAEQ